MPRLLRNAYTAVLARGDVWAGEVHTEPYEAAWAAEAVFFVHVMEVTQGSAGHAVARVQISPDGLRWVDEGAQMRIEARRDVLSFARVNNFGGWLRLSVIVPDGAGIKVVATLALKG